MCTTRADRELNAIATCTGKQFRTPAFLGMVVVPSAIAQTMVQADGKMDCDIENLVENTTTEDSFIWMPSKAAARQM